MAAIRCHGDLRLGVDDGDVDFVDLHQAARKVLVEKVERERAGEPLRNGIVVESARVVVLNLFNGVTHTEQMLALQRWPTMEVRLEAGVDLAFQLLQVRVYVQRL